MSKIKKLSITLISAIICIMSAFVFVGCKDNSKYSKLYVFSTEGGSVQINDLEERVKFGDEGSKFFSFKEESSVHLKAIAEEGYSFVKWEYSDNLEEEYDTFSLNAEIDLIMDEDIISIKAIFEQSAPSHYTINYTNGAGYNVVLQEGYSTTVEPNGTFSFKVNVLEGYNAETLSVKINDETLLPVDGVYSISNINEDKTITVDVKKYTYNITITNGTGYTIVAESGYTTNNVEYGSTYKFKVQLDELYNNSDIAVKAKSENGETTDLYANSNIYSLQVKQNCEIWVEGVEINTYEVSLPNITDVDIKITDTTITVSNGKAIVKQNDSLSFTVTTSNSEVDLSNITVELDGKTLSPNSGIYTINNITKNVTITITNVKYVTYSVSENDDKFSISATSGSLETTKGGAISFRVTIATGYKKGSAFKVYANGTELTAVNEIYTISNITANVTITASGIEVQTYTISLPTNSAYNVEISSGYSTTVEYGKEFKFTVTMNEGYNTNIVVKANGTTLTASGGEYTISNIVNNVTITVENVSLIKYKVTIPTSSAYTITASSGYSTSVEYGKDFKFEIELKEGYTKTSSFAIKSNGIALTEDGGVYTISNIKQNIQITVEGVEIISYNIILPTSEMFTLNVAEGYTTSVVYGANFKFTITINDGYVTGNKFSIKSNGTTLTASDDVYTISNIKQEIQVTVEGVGEPLVVSIPIATEYTINAVSGYKSTVIAGDDFKFTLTIKDGYIKTSDFAVKAGSETLIEENGVYTISNISSNLQILVEGVVKAVVVTFVQPTSDSAMILYNDQQVTTANIAPNSDLIFKVKIETSLKDKYGILIKVQDYQIDTVASTVDGDYTIIEHSMSNVSIDIEISIYISSAYFYSMDYSDTDTYAEDLSNAVSSIEFTFNMLDMPQNGIDGSEVEVTINEINITTLKAVIDSINEVLQDGGNKLDSICDGDVEFIKVNYNTDGTYYLTFNWSVLDLSEGVATITWINK